MNTLFALDQQLFLWINHLPHERLFNLFGQFFSGIGMFGIVWFILGAWLFFKEEKKDHRFWLPIFFAGITSWVFADLILKPLVGRLRPTVEMGAIIVGSPASDASFPSGHATIAFAMAVIFSKKEPRWRWGFYLLAVAIGISRIYLGKHYPADVLAGGFLGILIGWLSLMLGSFVQARLTPS